MKKFISILSIIMTVFISCNKTIDNSLTNLSNDNSTIVKPLTSRTLSEIISTSNIKLLEPKVNTGSDTFNNQIFQLTKNELAKRQLSFSQDNSQDKNIKSLSIPITNVTLPSTPPMPYFQQSQGTINSRPLTDLDLQKRGIYINTAHYKTIVWQYALRNNWKQIGSYGRTVRLEPVTNPSGRNLSLSYNQQFNWPDPPSISSINPIISLESTLLDIEKAELIITQAFPIKQPFNTGVSTSTISFHSTSGYSLSKTVTYSANVTKTYKGEIIWPGGKIGTSLSIGFGYTNGTTDTWSNLETTISTYSYTPSPNESPKFLQMWRIPVKYSYKIRIPIFVNTDGYIGLDWGRKVGPNGNLHYYWGYNLSNVVGIKSFNDEDVSIMNATSYIYQPVIIN
jgi:hypothetical protein